MGVTDTEVLRKDNRYELRIDGKLAGLAAFLDRDGQRVFHHTEVNNAYRGQGLSTVLIEQALADTKEAGLRIVAVCPAVAAYLGKHDGFADVTDPVTDEIMDWLEAKFDKKR
nr:GNAT family N-acetyltransferase [Kutzneria chonburiensis]